MGRRQPRIGLPHGLLLRPWQSLDAPGLLLAHRDPMVARYAGVLVADRGAALESIRRTGHDWSDGAGAGWVVSDATEQVLGSLRFRLLDSSLGTASVGYWLTPEVRGRGIVTMGLRAASRVMFDQLGWHRIELYHAVENDRSCAVARRCGYRYEGVMRQAMRYPVDDRWSDEHLHARLVTDPDPSRGVRSS
jgi:ribosomal-protein-alanine N-acetyltransferase